MKVHHICPPTGFVEDANILIDVIDAGHAAICFALPVYSPIV